MSQPAVKPDRTLVVILVVITALVVIALTVVLFRGAPAALSPDTPEGVAQAYSAAVIDGDIAAAEALLTPALQENCESVDNGIVRGIRLTLVSTKLAGDTARVRVSVVTTDNGGLIGGMDYAQDDMFVLVKAQGSWAVETAPWQLTVCADTKAN